MVAAAWITPDPARALMVLSHTEELARETWGHRQHLSRVLLKDSNTKRDLLHKNTDHLALSPKGSRILVMFPEKNGIFLCAHIGNIP